jgi:hypothetical protein
MKSLNLIRFFNFCAGFAVGGFLLTLVGCAGSPGMTAKEVHREHVNAVSADWLLLQKDIDEFLMIDQPSRLGDSITR